MPHHPLHKLTHLGRTIDSRDPTNLALLVLTPLVGLLGALARYHEGAPAQLILVAFLLGGLTALLTWALGRELSPDHKPTALLAVALIIPLVARGQLLDLHAVAVALLLTRVVNRSVGPPAKLGDLVFVQALVLLLVVPRMCWPVALVAALAFWWDSVLLDRNPRARVFSAMAIAAGMIVLSIELGPHPEQLDACSGEMTPLLIAAALIAALFGAVTAWQPAPASKCDIVDWSLSRARVQAGMLTTLLLAIAVTAWHGRGGEVAQLYAAAPLWLTMAAVVLGRLGARARGV
ncbi:MAG: hypothetical protein H6713_06530 [Myxococcales bacterium]|nr:hypothetical protein [Myxococcales bacterium]MCB9749649.1 hypothetical protein [Myxococcales bacterium]